MSEENFDVYDDEGKTIDYLEEDTEIPTQRYGIVSFISPEKVIKQKNTFLNEKFIQWLDYDWKVKGMEKFFLRIVLADQELQIIHHQHINGTQRFLEFHGGLAAQRRDEAIHEFLGTHVGHMARGVLFANGPGNGMHQMRLAKPNATIKK